MIITETDLAAMVRSIVDAVQPERIILFGSSMARGEATEESDIDLLVMEREGFTGRSRWRELQAIRKAIADFRISKDILLYSRDEVVRRQRSMNHIVAHAMKEGRLLYERS
ncbi:MAG: hypothetical protein A3G18_02835 [Rhodospirillales bacterium RIFCSPLOWO2_12_FULL_58_28]|nr:MAG: hypothetical protein A3H92_00800 [Rhodospirillales bacterium RIFCSPLOWO2_02_FULL_58_16]OHC77083.1 MAG: hypothetical protein A3G18_02835 [Rhodospirillales bacterium RIFCSPLOWO2_12_FULL_58_28]